MNDNQTFLEALRPYAQIGLTAPAGADGDSVGTQCSLRELLLEAFPQKRVRIINEEPCPNRYKFLKGAEHFEVSSDVLKNKDLPEAMVCVDGGAARIGPETTRIWQAAKVRGQVDHHALGGSTDGYGFRLYDPKAASTTELVYRFLKSTGLKLTPTVAQAIYVGLIFDTGLFKHSNTRPDILRIAAELMETGFNHTETVEKALLMRSEGSFKMLQTVLAKAQFEVQGRYVWGVLDYAAFQAAGGNADDREGLIDQLFLTERCEIAAFYFEKSPKEWKISFRSRGRNVAALAQSLHPSGGGHIQAAGTSLNGSAAEVLARCHEAVTKALEK